MGWGDSSDVDGFAIAMIAILAIALGTVLILLIPMLRDSRRRDDAVDLLIGELEDETSAEAPLVTRRTEPRPPDKEPWERDGDWWKE